MSHKYRIYRKSGSWVRFLSSDDLDKVKNTVSVLASQLQETVALVAQDPDDEKIIHIAFSQPPLLLEDQTIIA